MNLPLKPRQLITVEEADKLIPQRRLIARIGNGEWASELYKLDDLNMYVAKGPFGYHDGICFVVCTFNDVRGEQEWIKKYEAFWK